MARKSKKSKDVFTLTVPLSYNSQEKKLLDRLFSAGLMIEHHLISRKLKALHQLERTKAWKQVQADIAKKYKDGSDAKDPELRRLFERRANLLQEARLTASCFEKDAKRHARVYKGIVHSQTVQKLAANVWASFDEYLYGNGKTIHFKSWKDFLSMYGKSNETAFDTKMDV